MPKKSKRIAVRHAQLSGRAKRVRPHGPSGIPTKAPQPPVSKLLSEEGASVDFLPEEPTADPQSASPDQAKTGPLTSSSRTLRKGVARPSPAAYFKSEVRRIALVTGFISAILIVLILVL